MAGEDRRDPRYHLVVGVALGMSLTLIAVLLARPLFAAPQWEPGELVVLSGRDDSATQQRRALIDEWNDLHQDAPATIVELSGNADQQRNEMVRRAQDPDSHVDVYNMDVTWTAEFAENDYIVPLTGVDTTGFLEPALDTCLYERRLDGVPFSGEQLWAVPFNTDAGLLYYREDLVPTAPASWDAMATESREVLADARDPAVEAGFTSQLDNYEGLTVNALEMLRELDSSIEVDDAGRLPFDLGSLEKTVARLRPGKDGVVLRDSLDYDEQRSTQAMQDGRALFLRNWPLAIRTLTTKSEKPANAPDRTFQVTQLPGGSVLGGQNLAVARHSTQPVAATELIRFLTREDHQRQLFVEGGFAATRDAVYDDPSVQAEFRYANDMRAAVNIAEPRPEGPCYARFSKLFRDVLTRSIESEVALPEDFVEQLDAALNCRPAPPSP